MSQLTFESKSPKVLVNFFVNRGSYMHITDKSVGLQKKGNLKKDNTHIPQHRIEH